MVHLKVVGDQEHLLAGILAQPPEEGDEPIGVQGTLIQHEAHQAAVADRRDHALRDPLGRADYHGRLPFRCVSTPDLVLIGDPGLVAPVDRGTVGLGALGDRRIGRLQPGRDRRRLALPRPGQGLLRILSLLPPSSLLYLVGPFTRWTRRGQEATGL